MRASIQEYIEELLQEVEVEHKAEMESLDKDFLGSNARYLNESYQHEVMDRAWIQTENWDTYVKTSPFILLNPKLFGLAYVIEGLMAHFYQEVAQDSSLRGEN